MSDNKTTALTPEERITALEATSEQQKKTIDALTKQLEKQPANAAVTPFEVPKIPEDSFTVDKKEYKFVVPVFMYKNERLTALDALTSKEVLKDLVKMGSGVIAEIFE